MKLLGKKVLPVVRRDQLSISYACSVVFGCSDMFRYADINENEVMRECIKELRKQNKEQNWIVNSINSDGSFDLLSDMGYLQNKVSRRDFRVLR